jgi:hypothetical protein
MKPICKTPNDSWRYANFTSAVKGLSNWQIAKCFNVLDSGSDYRGMNKTTMAQHFIDGDMSHVTGEQLRDSVRKVMGF